MTIGQNGQNLSENEDFPSIPLAKKMRLSEGEMRIEMRISEGCIGVGKSLETNTKLVPLRDKSTIFNPYADWTPSLEYLPDTVDVLCPFEPQEPNAEAVGFTFAGLTYTTNGNIVISDLREIAIQKKNSQEEIISQFAQKIQEIMHNVLGDTNKSPKDFPSDSFIAKAANPGGILFKGLIDAKTEDRESNAQREKTTSDKKTTCDKPLKPSLLDAVIKSLGIKVMNNYKAGAALRDRAEEDTEGKNLVVDVFNASAELPEVQIEPHQEMSYQPTFPTRFFLYMDTPASCGGGQSGVSDMRSATKRFKEVMFEQAAPLKSKISVLDRIISEKILYQFVMHPDDEPHSYYNWKKQIGNTIEECERVMKSKGYSWEWIYDLDKAYTTTQSDPSSFLHSDPSSNKIKLYSPNKTVDSSVGEPILRLWYILPGVVNHPLTGELLYFNQISALHESYFWYHPGWKKAEIRTFNADGKGIQVQMLKRQTREKTEKDSISVLPPFSVHWSKSREVVTADEVGKIREIIWRNTKVTALQTGDLLCLDNMLTSHSRLGWTPGIERKLRVMLAAESSF